MSFHTLTCVHGFSDAAAFFGSQYGPGIGPVYLDNVQCLGVEDSLVNCTRSRFGDVSLNCADHSQDASVFCPSKYMSNTEINYDVCLHI